ncbi:MAG TPA: ATP-dependent zinc metalloprotease FtsH [Candidatus Dormibacteraeota bacterium]
MRFRGRSRGPFRRRRTERPTHEASTISQRRTVRLLIAGLLLLVVAFVLVIVLAQPSSSGDQLRYDEYLSDIRANRIESATVNVQDTRITGTYDAGQYWISYGGAVQGNVLFQNMLQGLQTARVPTTIDQQTLKAAIQPLIFVLPTFIFIDAFVLVFLTIRQGGGGLAQFGQSGSRRVKHGETRITFKDVAGVDEAVEELAEIRDYLEAPQRFLQMGARVPSGILLVGPPGCGKTLLARAVAGEARVPFFSMSGSDFVEIFVGVGAARIRDLFREARLASPAIVFIDELDAVGRGRTAAAISGQDEREATLNQLLVGLDGFESEPGVVVVSATNRPDVLDPALLRPGRFDRRVYVDLPDLNGRVGILEVHCRGKPLDDGVNLQALAKRTAGFSGADLASVVNEAALLAARRAQTAISQALLSEAVERVMAGPEQRTRVLTPHDKELVAYHESGHALVSAVVNAADRVTKISIVSRGRAGGHTWFVQEEERRLATKAQLSARLAALLGGRAAEQLISGEPTSGAQDDLERATAMARRMVCELGMSEKVGPISLSMNVPRLMGDAEFFTQYSPELAATIDSEVRALLEAARQEATEVLEQRRSMLDTIAHKLQETETLEGDELDALLYEGRQDKDTKAAGVAP